MHVTFPLTRMVVASGLTAVQVSEGLAPSHVGKFSQANGDGHYSTTLRFGALRLLVEILFQT